MKLSGLLPSFPPPHPPTAAARNRCCSSVVRKQEECNDLALTPISNFLNTVYPMASSIDLARSYNSYFCQNPTSKRIARNQTMTSPQSQILNSSDTSPYQQSASDIVSHRAATNNSWQLQDQNSQSPSFRTYQFKNLTRVPYGSLQNHKASNDPIPSEDANISNLASHTES